MLSCLWERQDWYVLKLFYWKNNWTVSINMILRITYIIFIVSYFLPVAILSLPVQLRSEWELLYIRWDLWIYRDASFRKRKQTPALIYWKVPGSEEINPLLYVEFHIHVSNMIPWLQVPIQNQKLAVIYKTFLWNSRYNNNAILAIGCMVSRELFYNDLEREMISVDNKSLKIKK